MLTWVAADEVTVPPPGQELEMLGNPGAQGFKTKRETQAKYGWSS